MVGESNESGATRKRKRKLIDVEAYEEKVPLATVEKSLRGPTTEQKDTVDT